MNLDIKTSVKPEAVIEAVTKYRERFQETYDAMLELYAQAAQEYEEKYRDYVKKIIDKTIADDEKKPIDPKRPTNRTKDYDLVLSMLHQHLRASDEPIQLGAEEYDVLMNDNWGWRHSLHSEIRYWMDYDLDSTTTTSTSTVSLGYQAALYGLQV